MKHPLTKKLSVFIIVMMFSISYLDAQCPANKVQMFKPKLHGLCISKCVPANQVDKYVSNGWWYWCYIGTGSAKTPAKKMPNKPLVKNPGGDVIVSKKAGSK